MFTAVFVLDICNLVVRLHGSRRRGRASCVGGMMRRIGVLVVDPVAGGPERAVRLMVGGGGVVGGGGGAAVGGGGAEGCCCCRGRR